ncbi:MAG: bacteriohemerythrin, partial [Leptospiraceae bacterium]|nr:bacteriohemerythrin [Leptospiraceae bacterium]
MILEKKASELEVFPWDKNFEIGVPEIDDQHKILVRLLNSLGNTLINKDSIEIDEAFKKLYEYTEYHFEAEEEIWYKYFGKDDPWFTSHQLSHASFLPKLNEIKENKVNSPLSEIIEEILKFLIRWLAFHIIDNDKRMSFFIKSIMEGKTFSESKDYADRKMSGAMRLMIETILNMYDGLSSRALDLIRERNARIKAEKEKEELIHILTHDILNPIAGIKSTCNLLELNPDKCKEYLPLLESSADHGIEIINLVKNMINDKNLNNLDLQEYNLKDLINESIMMLKELIENKNLELELDIDKNFFVKVEKTSFINSIINNLLTNAIKFSHKNNRVLLFTKISHNSKQLVIQDFGIGIPEYILKNIYDLKMKTSRRGTNNELGTGYSMPLVKKFLDI